jgi:hypothetical protein
VSAPTLHLAQFGPPSHVGIGEDGIPDFIVATRGSPYFYAAPQGYRLIVTHNGTPVHLIVEADRRRGWAIGFHYTEYPDRLVAHKTDDNGIEQHRLYRGTIRFQLEPLS